MTNRHRLGLLPTWGHVVLLAVAAGSLACGRLASPADGSEWIEPHRFSYLEPIPRRSGAGDEQLYDQLAFLQSLRGGRLVQPELDAETCAQICWASQNDENDENDENDAIHLESCQYATVVRPFRKTQQVVVCNGSVEGHWQLPMEG